MNTLEDFKQQFQICMPLFIALGDEVRLSIIETLSDNATDQLSESQSAPYKNLYLTHGGLNVKEITENVNLSRPAVSHHLKILKDAGLIGVSRRGSCNYYYLTLESGVDELMKLGKQLQDNFYPKA